MLSYYLGITVTDKEIEHGRCMSFHSLLIIFELLHRLKKWIKTLTLSIFFLNNGKIVIRNVSCEQLIGYIFVCLPHFQLRHSISVASLGSVDDIGVSAPNPWKSPETLVVKVSLETTESHHTNHYKSIMVCCKLFYYSICMLFLCRFGILLLNLAKNWLMNLPIFAAHKQRSHEECFAKDSYQVQRGSQPRGLYHVSNLARRR